MAVLHTRSIVRHAAGARVYYSGRDPEAMFGTRRQETRGSRRQLVVLAGGHSPGHAVADSAECWMGAWGSISDWDYSSDAGQIFERVVTSRAET